VAKKSCVNVHSIKAVLILLKVISSLKVNFHKSILVGVNDSNLWLIQAMVVLNYRAHYIPFLYLSLPMGGDSRLLQLCYHLLDHIKKDCLVGKAVIC